jgi:hypothetical protein
VCVIQRKVFGVVFYAVLFCRTAVLAAKYARTMRCVSKLDFGDGSGASALVNIRGATRSVVCLSFWRRLSFARPCNHRNTDDRQKLQS